MAEQYVRVKPSVIVRFVNTMEAYVGNFARDSFYKIVKQAVSDQILRSKKKTDLKTFMKEFDIGECNIQCIEDLTILDIKDSVFAQDAVEQLGRFGRPVCLFIAAALAGAQTAITGRQYECIERKCIATGEEYCQFVIYPAEKKWETILTYLK